EGPYRAVRNPFYLGTILKDLGVCLISANLYLVAACLLVLVPMLRRRVLREERRLRESFGEPYAQYLRTVPRFLPWVTSWPRLLSRAGQPDPGLLPRNLILPRILNLWAFLIAIIDLSDLRWQREWLEPRAAHLAPLVVSGVLLAASSILGRAGRILRTEAVR